MQRSNHSRENPGHRSLTFGEGSRESDAGAQSARRGAGKEVCVSTRTPKSPFRRDAGVLTRRKTCENQWLAKAPSESVVGNPCGRGQPHSGRQTDFGLRVQTAAAPINSPGCAQTPSTRSVQARLRAQMTPARRDNDHWPARTSGEQAGPADLIALAAGAARVGHSTLSCDHAPRKSQRDFVTKPMVARHELPWGIGPPPTQPQRGCGDCVADGERRRPQPRCG